jgi:asparagine synthase (glutamine-hydrolysing)
MISADVNVVLPDDFLVKVDRASMAHGLEVRPPLLDHELFELAAQIPSRFKVRAGETKWILRQAYRDRLPDEILWRPKHGFEVPIDAWLRGPLRSMFEEAVFDPQARVRDFVDVGTARKVYEAHLEGRGKHGGEQAIGYGPVLWALLVLARWAERYLPSASPIVSVK